MRCADNSASSLSLSPSEGSRAETQKIVAYMLGTAVEIAASSVRLSPIEYTSGSFGPHAHLADFNPFTHMLAVVRGPLLGAYPRLMSWLVLILFSLFGWTVAFLFFAQFRNGIAYWL